MKRPMGARAAAGRAGLQLAISFNIGNYYALQNGYSYPATAGKLLLKNRLPGLKKLDNRPKRSKLIDSIEREFRTCVQKQAEGTGRYCGLSICLFLLCGLEKLLESLELKG